MKPRLLVFNSGSGSGFENLVKYGIHGDYHVIGLIADREDRPAVGRAKRLDIKYSIMHNNTEQEYQRMIDLYEADFVALSGWLKKTKGLNPQTTINIHPGPLPNFGGKGMYGHHVHESVIKAYKRGEIEYSAVSMHFVTDQYDMGPVIISVPVKILPEYTPETLGTAVNAIEHLIQPFVTNLLVTGEIHWDGVHPESLTLPDVLEAINKFTV